MTEINHINYPDDNNRIYCRAKNNIITLDKEGNYWNTCTKCKYFNGSYQGLGVECLWEDSGEDISQKVFDPNSEYLRVSKQLDNKEV